MKIIVPISVFLAIFSLLLPFFAAKTPLPSNSPAPTVEVTTAAAVAEPTPSPTADYNLISSFDSAVSLTLQTNGEIITIKMSDYLVGVVAAEMPANFYDEALKAQAVAVRTFTYYSASGASANSVHPDADVCDNPVHCKAWLSDEALREKWGDNYDVYIAKIKSAVVATDGLCAVYEDKPILAVFHAASGGFTEDSANVWGEALPYLRSVQSPESPASVPDFVTEPAFSLSEFKRLALEVYPDMDLSGASETWFGEESRSPNGRLLSVALGGVKLSGTQLRNLFGLRSANAVWTISVSEIRFTVTGYGHGVGMSQFGANEFARNGADFKSILQYYYKGVEIEVISQAL
ncbi:MAG: stage II sporulation protein D [Oscillospiraceae bacterium]|jgi:stage II sporulation protein D|nr:stage II sporulation protein D [Oscillospiraceae bacterium]